MPLYAASRSVALLLTEKVRLKLLGRQTIVLELELELGTVIQASLSR